MPGVLLEAEAEGDLRHLGHTRGTRATRTTRTTRLTGSTRFTRVTGNHHLDAELAEFDESDLDHEAFVARSAVVDIAGIEDVECLEEPHRDTMSGLVCVTLTDRVAGLEQRQGLRVLGNEHVAQVLG